MKLSKISASMIRDYNNCPKLFLYRHVLGLQFPEKPIQLLFGSAVHKAIETFHDTGKAELAFKEIEVVMPIDLVPTDEKGNYSTHYEEAHRLVETYINSQDYLHDCYGISSKGKSEVYFKQPVIDPETGENLGLTMNGLIDRVTEDGDILEFKTSSKPYKQADADLMVQPAVYTKAYHSIYKKMPNRVLYVVLIKGRKDALQVVETKRDITHLLKLHKEIVRIKKSVENERFPQGSGFMHKWCDCYKYEKMLGL